jgi:hypothetical protein
MDIKNIWQVNSGSCGATFFHYDIMGISVPFSKRKYAGIESSIRNFYRIAQRNDAVVLRSGANKISAVGIIVGNHPIIRNEFKDANGSLLHIRRIRWIKAEKKFSVRVGSQARTFVRVNAPTVRYWVKGLKVSRESLTRTLKRLPVNC